jgi:hypothetical protein
LKPNPSARTIKNRNKKLFQDLVAKNAPSILLIKDDNSNQAKQENDNLKRSKYTGFCQNCYNKTGKSKAEEEGELAQKLQEDGEKSKRKGTAIESGNNL